MTGSFQVHCESQPTRLKERHTAVLHCSLACRLRAAARGALHAACRQPEHKSQLGWKCPVRGVLWLCVFVGWGQTSFLAEGSKSSCVLLAVLAEQPNQVWSFGGGRELPFLLGGLRPSTERFAVPPLLLLFLLPSPACEQAGRCCAWGARSRGAEELP